MDILRITKPDREWYEIIIWWELRRVPFNIIMYFIGLASFYIGYVTIPLLYLVIGLILNIGYAFCWIIELAVIKKHDATTKMKYPRIAFFSYLTISTAIVFGFALFLFL
jgi:hypothetical protein